MRILTLHIIIILLIDCYLIQIIKIPNKEYYHVIMQKQSLVQPEQIRDELNLLCNGMVRCQKKSRTGFYSNERMIAIRDGWFEYYRVHQSSSQSSFKGGVLLQYIQQLQFSSTDRLNDTLNVVFRTDARCDTKKQQQDFSSGKIGTSRETWTFTLKANIQQIIDANRQKEMQVKRSAVQVIMPVVEIQIENEREEEKNVINYINSFENIKSYFKSKREKEEDQHRKQFGRRKEGALRTKTAEFAKEEQEEQFSKVSLMWRQYNRLYDKLLLHRNRGSINLDEEVQFLYEIQFFNQNAIRTVQMYIDEKLAGLVGEAVQLQSFFYYKGIWLRVGGKELNHIFNLNYYLADILYSLGDMKEYNFRVPLLSFVQYKGYKVLCMCNMPFNEIEVYNLRNEKCDLQLMAKMKEVFDVYEDVLNIKNELQDIHGKKIHSPLGHTLKVYEYSAKRDPLQDGILNNFYFVMPIDRILPLDFNYQHPVPSLDARFRPEMVALLREYYQEGDSKLLAQAFMDSTSPPEVKKNEDQKIVKASQLIVQVIIPQLVRKLDALHIMWVDSISMKKSLEQFGINVRYLYHIYNKVSPPYVRDIILVDILARTIKKQLREYIYQLPKRENLMQKSQFVKSNNKKLFLQESIIAANNSYDQMVIDFLNLVFGIGDETDKFWQIIAEKTEKYYFIKINLPLKVKPGCLLNAVLWHCKLGIYYNFQIPLFKTEQPFNQRTKITHEVRYKIFDFPSMQVQKIFKRVPPIQNDEAELQIFKYISMKLLKLQFFFKKTLLNKSFEVQLVLSKINAMSEFMDKPQVQKTNPCLLSYYITNKTQVNFQRGLQLLNFSFPQSHPLYVSFYLQYSTVVDSDLLRKAAVLLSVKSLGDTHVKTTELYTKFYKIGDNSYKNKAKKVPTVLGSKQFCDQLYAEKAYEACLDYVLNCIPQFNLKNDKNSLQKVSLGNYQAYLSLLLQGLESSLILQRFDEGILISRETSSVLTTFKPTNQKYYFELLYNTLRIHLLTTDKKYFIYKIVLLAVHIRKENEYTKVDEMGIALPQVEAKGQLLKGIDSVYYEYICHSQWIFFILNTIKCSFKYFNFLKDLFNEYRHHIQRYNNNNFKIALGYLDTLIRLYGESVFRRCLYEVCMK